MIVLRRERPGWLGEQERHRFLPQGRITTDSTEGGRFLDSPEEEERSPRDQATIDEGRESSENSNVRGDSQ